MSNFVICVALNDIKLMSELAPGFPKIIIQISNAFESKTR